MTGNASKFTGFRPLLYSGFWLKAIFRVLQQRMLMAWMFHFNSTPLQQKSFLGKGE
jgi:hypothetical protein